MSTFNVGDRVRVVNDQVYAYANGATGTVVNVDPYPATLYPYLVRYDTPVGFNGREEGVHKADELEPLSTRTPEDSVYLYQDKAYGSLTSVLAAANITRVPVAAS